MVETTSFWGKASDYVNSDFAFTEMGSSQWKENYFWIESPLCLVCGGDNVGGLKISIDSRHSFGWMVE